MIYVYEENTSGEGDDNEDSDENRTIIINGSEITYNPNTLSYVSGGDSNVYENYTYLDFRDGTIFVLNESNNEVVYNSIEYTPDTDNSNDIFVTNNGNYYYYKNNNSITFMEREKIKGVIISNSVQIISNDAFFQCSDLTNVTIGNFVETIGNSAFFGCESFTEVTIPNSVITIDINAFSGCSNLTNLTIGNSVETINTNAFSQCSNLIIVTIPDSVITIGMYAFYGCENLKYVYIPNNNEITFISNAFDNRYIETIYIIIEQEGEDISTIKDKLISIGIHESKIATIPREIFNQQFP